MGGREILFAADWNRAVGGTAVTSLQEHTPTVINQISSMALCQKTHLHFLWNKQSSVLDSERCKQRSEPCLYSLSERDPNSDSCACAEGYTLSRDRKYCEGNVRMHESCPFWQVERALLVQCVCGCLWLEFVGLGSSRASKKNKLQSSSFLARSLPPFLLCPEGAFSSVLISSILSDLMLPDATH